MDAQQSPAPGHPALTDAQRASLDYARRDLETFRATDLAGLEAASLILVVARLLTRLDDTLRVVDEITPS